VSYTEIYKPGQGKYVRIGTLIGMGILMSFGMYWVGYQLLGSMSSLWIRAVSVLVFGAVWAIVALYIVNKPSWAEFMIMTESEMRKVHWPSRQVVINSTKVVIMLTLVLALVLFAVDWGFFNLFSKIGLLSQ